jgi:hypothetical protein
MSGSVSLRRSAPFILFIVGCHDRIADPGSPVDRAVSVTATSLVDQTGVVGAEAPSPPTVLVRDAAGNPVAGVLVLFDGPVPKTAFTASDGTATLHWVLPFIPGSYSIVAYVGKLAAVRFSISAVAGPPAQIIAKTPLDQAVLPGATAAEPPAVLVTDWVNNPLAGVAVRFEMGGPAGGTIEHASAVTNDLGIASAGTWTLGTAIGVYTLTAHVDGVLQPPPTLNAHVYEPFVVSTIAAGANATCANALSGATYCWGDAWAFPTRIQGDTRFASLTVGTGYACGLTAAGAAFCWGRDVTRADADPGSAILGVPRRIGGDSLFRLISAGETLACGLSMAGRAYCWGENTYGQLGNGTTDGSTVPTPVAGDHTFTTLTTGISHACGETTDGETYCWGRNDTRQLGDASSETCDFVEYDYYYAPVLTRTPCEKLPRRVDVAPPLVSVTAGEGTCGLSSDGKAFCWGHSHEVELVSSTLRFATITATHQIAIQSPPSTTFAFSSMCGTTLSGAVYCDDEDAGLVEVAANLAFSTVVSGATHQCGIQRGSGIAYCWGSNYMAQLGNGTLLTTNAPTPVVAP